MQTETMPAELTGAEVGAPAVAPSCGTCGATGAPDGACFEVGTCERADRLATAGASGSRAKFPAAWTARGYVD